LIFKTVKKTTTRAEVKNREILLCIGTRYLGVSKYNKIQQKNIFTANFVALKFAASQ
jgi:hypothetical protein